MDKRYPELKTRVQSTFIDLILMVCLMFLAAWIFDQVKDNNEEEENGVAKAIVFVCIWGIYEPLCMTFGATLGNYLMKIRVRRVTDNTKRINILQAFIRFIVKIVLGWISFLTIHTNDERRAIHDMAAGSVMIEK